MSDALIVKEDDSWYAIHLDAPHRFQGIRLNARYRLEGAFLLGVEIEINHTRMVDRFRGEAPLGSLVRKAAQLDILAIFNDRQGFGDPIPFRILTALPETKDGGEVYFSDWQIVLGDGDDKRILYRCGAE